ncbi:MAG: LacI family DNA-binding transcriptional regulator [Spirochaetales bacterium]|nr:LacI family DNA-binding transcriptional regulator [Spirochaetales bacterium]
MSKKITRAQVAEAAGVSESTVSRALNNSPKISSSVIKKVQDLAVEMGYFPNRQAVLLTSDKTFRLGLVVRAYHNFSPFTRAYFPRLLDGVIQEAEQHGYTVTIIMDKVNDTYKDLSLMVKSREVDGLIFSVTAINDPRFPSLIENNIPLVLVNNKYEGITCVNCNPYPGMTDAITHLKNLGHKRIGYIGGDQRYWDGQARLEAFRTMTEDLDSGLIVTGNFSKSSGYSATDKLFRDDENITAIMTASDREAMGVLSYCNERGINVPGELSLIGFDNLGPARDMTPGLTTIQNPVTQLGSDAVSLLLERIEKKESWKWIERQSQFIMRHSTAKAYK